jgi:hypothetical protein
VAAGRAALRSPAAKLDAQTADLEAAAFEYLQTLRKILDAAALVPGVDKAALVALNEVYSGGVAATFSEFVSAFTAKRTQTVTFPKRHPDLTRVLDRVGDVREQLTGAGGDRQVG